MLVRARRIVHAAAAAGFVAAVWSAAAAAQAAPPEIDESAYARAEQFLSWNAERYVTGIEVEPNWLPGGRFWYRNRVRDGHEFVLVDPSTGTRRPAFDHTRLAAALSVAADTAYVAGKLPFREFRFTEDGSSIGFEVADSIHWRCDVVSYACTETDSAEVASPTEITSPDGAWVAFSRDHDLWIRAVESGEEIQLSTDGEEHYAYAAIPEGCCQEITTRRQETELPPVLRWAPDSRRIVTHRYDERDVGEFHLLETRVGRPTLHSWRYALPGDSVLPTAEYWTFDVAGGRATKADHPAVFGDFTRADSLWREVQWSDDGAKYYFLDRTRDFRTLELIEVDAASGAARTVLTETGPTLRETAPMIRDRNWRVVGDGAEVVWFSERDGWGHLYLVDGATGAVRNRITEGPWLVVDVLEVDADARAIYFTAVGREAGRDPYFRHLYRASLDGSSVTLLSPEDADHEVSVGPDGGVFVDRYSRRDLPPTTVLRDRTGRVTQTVQESDIDPLLELGWKPPTPFKAKGRDGVTDVYGYLYFPTDFDPDGSYPVIDYVYPGPQVGPIGFRDFSLGGWAGQHALPELGFIVFTVDAMGTPLRDKAFHDGYYADMGDNGIPDHIAALKYLASVHPQMDLDRVGIFGHSGGGFASTGAILRYPEFFKVAVSGAGNHDNRGYHFPWAERYQGLLVHDSANGGDNYDSQANQELAGNLEGKLLLSYGGLDDNVHPNNTLLLIDALVKNNKDFDLFVLPNRNHGHARDAYSIRRTWDYFVVHLLGARPPHEYKLSPPPER
jgi:dipeptidyl-peptidase-4